MRTWMDHVGNVHGRVDGANASAPALLLGSHYDTVFDAGKFDGANAGANACFSNGTAAFVYSESDHTLYFDDNDPFQWGIS